MAVNAARRPAAFDPPATDLRAVIVVPARNEEQHIGACLDALATQVEIEPGAYETIVVLDACTDGTERQVEMARRRWPELRLLALAGPGRGAGPARATGMDVACARLESVGQVEGLLATTDADSVVAPDWIARQLDAIGTGAEAIGGEILLDAGESERLSGATIRGREADLAERTRLAQSRGPAEHAHFAGASIGLTPRAYRRAGGMGWLAALEDQELEDRLAAAGVQIHRLRPVQVTTSARTDGRAERGLALDLALADWLVERSYVGGEYTLAQLLAAKRASVAVVLPTREVASTIGPTLDHLLPLRAAGLVDELLVVDADSADDTAAIARARGAETVSESALAPELGPCLGKGDAMWRAAGIVESELLVFLDADSVDFQPGFLIGMLGPILLDPALKLVKGAFHRPFACGGTTQDGEGGRVTELVARPLLNLHFPALAGFVQPLAGEIAIERDLVRRLAVPVGYGVEIAMLIDCLRLVGLDALAQVDLGSRQNRHQSLRALSAMAVEVMVAVERRTGSATRPDTASFRPRPRDGAAEKWRLRCEERLPIATAPVGRFGPRGEAGKSYSPIDDPRPSLPLRDPPPPGKAYSMTDHEQAQEQTAGGLLGKAAGRAKEIVGSALGNDRLDREGRLQQVQVEAEEEAIERGQVAEEKDAEAKLKIAKAETESERRELEQELAQLSDEERIERERQQGKRQVEAAHAEEIRRAAALEREASKAERVAEAIDPESGR